MDAKKTPTADSTMAEIAAESFDFIARMAEHGGILSGQDAMFDLAMIARFARRSAENFRRVAKE